jgi:hypothetical protein
MDRLTNIVKGRIACIMGSGKSIEALEDKIYDLKDYDLCWTSLSIFPIMEKYILKNINKHLEVVLHCTSVPKSKRMKYEKYRLNMLRPFLAREEKNLYLTTKGIAQRDWKELGLITFWNDFCSKTLIIDNYLNVFDVPNSLSILIMALAEAGAKKIILFGCDGCKTETNLHTYYKPEIREEERAICFDGKETSGIQRDTSNFNQKFDLIYKYNVPIVNCSPNTIINTGKIKNVTYEKLEDEIK